MNRPVLDRYKGVLKYMPKLTWFVQGSCYLVLMQPGMPEGRIEIKDGTPLPDLLKLVQSFEDHLGSLSPETLAE